MNESEANERTNDIRESVRGRVGPRRVGGWGGDYMDGDGKGVVWCG